MKLLNSSDYYTIDSNDNGYGQSLYWNSGSGNCFSGDDNAVVDCDFTGTGLKNDATRNLISEVTYSLYSFDNIFYYPDQVYSYERTTGSVYLGRPISWLGKVALLYVSDYVYAADFDLCEKTYDGYNDANCVSTNWMTNILTNNKENYAYLINSRTELSDAVCYVRSSGSVGCEGNRVMYPREIIPTLYLNSNIFINSDTNGSNDNPYMLKIE